MKLSLTLHDKTYSVESEESFDGSNVYDLAEQFKGILVSAGFHPSNVDSIFNLDHQWFTEEERNDNLQGHLKEDLSLHSRAFESSQQDEYNKGYAKGWDEALHNKKVQDFQDNLYKHDYLAERAKELYEDDPEIELPK